METHTGWPFTTRSDCPWRYHNIIVRYKVDIGIGAERCSRVLLFLRCCLVHSTVSLVLVVDLVSHEGVSAQAPYGTHLPIK